MWSAPVTLTPPASEPVTIDEVKEFLVIEAEEVLYDQQLARFITAARQQVEAVTGTRLVPQIVRVAAREWHDLKALPIGPVRTVTSIAYDDTAGVSQVLATANWELFGTGLQTGIRPVYNAAWPAALRRQDAIRVTLEIGYDDVPGPVKTAILIMIADLFAQRESFAVGTVAAKVPSTMQVDSLLTNFRIWL
jgi:uncharacterized phiE125 gp8 family phage protein